MHQTSGMCYAACTDVMAWQGLPVSSTNMVLAILGGLTSKKAHRNGCVLFHY